MANGKSTKSVLTEEQAQKYAADLGLPFVRLIGKQIVSETLKIIPQAVAQENFLVCYEKTGNILRIAVGDPEKLKQKAPVFLTDLKNKRGYNLALAVTLPEDINYAMNMYSAAESKPMAPVNKISRASLIGKSIDINVLNKFPVEVAKKYKIICFESIGENTIKVGSVDPQNPHVKEILEFVKKRNNIDIEEFQISEEDFQYAVGLYTKASPSDKEVKAVKPPAAKARDVSPSKPVSAAVPPADTQASADVAGNQELNQKALFLSDKEFSLVQREEKIASVEQTLKLREEKLKKEEINLKTREDNLKNSQAKLGQDMTAMEQEKDVLARDKGKLALENQELTSQKQLLEQAKSEAEKQKKSLENDLAVFKKDKEALQKDLAEIQAQQNGLKNLQEEMQEKEKLLSEKQAALDHQTLFIEEQKKKLLSSRLEAAKKEKIIRQKEDDLIEKEQKANQAFELLKYLEKEKEDIKTQSAQLADKQKEIDGQKLLQDEIIKDQENLKIKAEEVQAKLAETEEEKELIEKEKEKLVSQMQLIKQEKEKYEHDQKRNDQYQEEIARLKDELAKSDKLVEEVENLKRQIEGQKANFSQEKETFLKQIQTLNKRQMAQIVPQPTSETDYKDTKQEQKNYLANEGTNQTSEKSSAKSWWNLDVKELSNIFGQNKLPAEQEESEKNVAYPDKTIFQPAEAPFWKEEEATTIEQNPRVEPIGAEERKKEIPVKSGEVKKDERPFIETAEKLKPKLYSENAANLPDENILDSYFPKGIKNKQELEKIVKQGSVPKIIAGILYLAGVMKASDIHLEPEEKIYRLRYRVDGVLHDILEMPLALQPPVVSRIKILSRLKIDETRIPQDGRFEVKVGARSIDLRVSTFPTAHGEKAEMRLLDKTSGILKIEDLGVAGEDLKKVNEAIAKPFGVVLVTGPTGSGKSTTLYAMLNKLSKPEINIVTLEDPVEYDIAGINQCQVNPKIGFGFAEGLRSILRQDPNIIMVGEIRDKETAELTTHAALTGHLVLSTLHTNDASGALPRLINMGIEPFLITSSINAIIAQRLVRKVCSKCKEEYKLPPSALEKIKKEISLSHSPDLTPWKNKTLKFYKPKGCSACADGYSGRIGLFEILVMSPKLEELTVSRRPASEIAEEAKREGMMTLREDGILKALQGMTSLDEVLRVTETEQTSVTI